MQFRSFILSVVQTAGVATTASALTFDEIKAKLEAAGYSQIREMGGTHRSNWRHTETPP